MDCFYAIGMKVNFLNIDDPRYPALLREIADPPQKLYFIGDLELFKRPKLAIVGTRRASAYGESQAFQMARELSQQGICIVSGLAYGIDAQAHAGALEGRGSTIAVLAQGLPEIRPTRNRNLAKRIVQSGGLLLSENEAGFPSLPYEYLKRNRIISGLSAGTLVVEAAAKSGAINTARHAVEQNREVMAIPGRITDPQSVGTNALLAANQAQLVMSAKQIGDVIYQPWQLPEINDLNGMQKSVFQLLQDGPKTSAELGEHFENKLREFYAALSNLELRGYIKRMSDLRYAVCSG